MQIGANEGENIKINLEDFEIDMENLGKGWRFKQFYKGFNGD